MCLHPRRSPARLERMAINSWSGSASQRARQVSVSSQPSRRYGGSGCNSITAVRSLDGRRSAGVPGMSNHPSGAHRFAL
jgi:hypothetical protein